MECTLEVKIVSRGYHVYGKSIWSNPKKGECLIGEQETGPVALLEDPYAIAWKLQKKDKLVPVVVGHIPREISRFVWYFMLLLTNCEVQIFSSMDRSNWSIRALLCSHNQHLGFTLDKTILKCTFQILGGCQGWRTGVAVTAVSNSLILGGWVTKVSKNGDKK